MTEGEDWFKSISERIKLSGNTFVKCPEYNQLQRNSKRVTWKKKKWSAEWSQLYRRLELQKNTPGKSSHIGSAVEAMFEH